MSAKKIIVTGIVLWVLMFLGVTVIGLIPLFAQMGEYGFEFTSMGHAMKYVYGIIISFLIGWWFFKKESSYAFQDGVACFVPVLLMGLFLDALITVPFFIQNYVAYFGDPFLWFGILLSWFAFAVAPMQQKKRK